MHIRPVRPSDVARLAAIYADAVLHGFGTFEETPPSEVETARRVEAVLGHRLPWLVAEIDGAVAGFAYAAPFRQRAAYRYTAEDSVYVDPAAKGSGVGRALLERIVGACEQRGLRRLIALIGDSGNTGSLRLHLACGFQQAGVLKAVGFKHGRWVDVVWMQRSLGRDDDSPPDSPGLSFGL